MKRKFVYRALSILGLVMFCVGWTENNDKAAWGGFLVAFIFMLAADGEGS